MMYSKRYIQYNDLPFDSYDMLASYDDTTVSFKTSGTSYTFKHGSYYGLKKEHGLISESSASFTLKLNMKKLNCEDRIHFVQWATNELTKAGKLWAVKNNEMIWAYAIPDNVSQVNSDEDYAEFDVDLILPEGIWHKADKQKTFLLQYDLCDWSNCHDFKDIDPCAKDDCCTCNTNNLSVACCDCDCVSAEDALCNFTDMQFFYGCSGSGYRVVYDCIKGEQLFTNELKPALGQKICSKECSPVIAGLVYAATDIPTDSYTITLNGTFTNPSITINGNENILNGEYNGQLVITGEGTATLYTDCCATEIDITKWEIPTGNDFLWEFKQGNNSIIIDTGNCCDTDCAYIQIDNLTI